MISSSIESNYRTRCVRAKPVSYYPFPFLSYLEVLSKVSHLFVSLTLLPFSRSIGEHFLELFSKQQLRSEFNNRLRFLHYEDTTISPHDKQHFPFQCDLYFNFSSRAESQLRVYTSFPLLVRVILRIQSLCGPLGMSLSTWQF